MPQIQDIHIHIMPKTVTHLCQSTGLMVSLLLPPWHTAIVGYWVNSNNSNSQQQPIAGYRQTSKSLPGTNLPTRTTNRIIQVC